MPRLRCSLFYHSFMCLYATIRSEQHSIPSPPRSISTLIFLFFLNATATTEIYTPLYTLSLHDALPISGTVRRGDTSGRRCCPSGQHENRSEEHTSELQSHSGISYAVFCLKKKKNE